MAALRFNISNSGPRHKLFYHPYLARIKENPVFVANVRIVKALRTKSRFDFGRDEKPAVNDLNKWRSS